MILLVILLSYLYVDLMGYLIHKLVHSNLIPSMKQAHKTHHTLYTHKDFLDTTYRDAEGDNLLFYYMPFALLSILFAYLFMNIVSFFVFLVILSLFGFGNDIIHTQIHLTNTRLIKYNWFRKLRFLHIQHHKHHDTNYGILSLLFDKVFGTFNNGKRKK